MEVLIYKALINLYTIHVKFVSVNNVLQEHNEIKEEIILKMLWNILYKTIESNYVNSKKLRTNVLDRRTEQNRLVLLSNCAVNGEKKIEIN